MGMGTFGNKFRLPQKVSLKIPETQARIDGRIFAIHVISTMREYCFAVGKKASRRRSTKGMLDGQKFFSRHQVPDVNGVIAAAAGQEFAVGRKGETCRMLFRRHRQGACWFPRFNFPEVDLACIPAGNDVFAIGRKDRADLVPLLGDCSHKSARLDLPKID